MADNESNQTGSARGPEDDTFSVVVVPANQAEAVFDFVAKLEAEEADVTGHMLTRGLSGGSGSRIVETRLTEDRSGTNCYWDSVYGYVCQDKPS